MENLWILERLLGFSFWASVRALLLSSSSSSSSFFHDHHRHHHHHQHLLPCMSKMLTMKNQPLSRRWMLKAMRSEGSSCQYIYIVFPILKRMEIKGRSDDFCFIYLLACFFFRKKKRKKMGFPMAYWDVGYGRLFICFDTRSLSNHFGIISRYQVLNQKCRFFEMLDFGIIKTYKALRCQFFFMS